MKTKMFLGLVAAVMIVSAPAFANTVTLDASQNWVGWMNVSETPANGGAYLWGSSWGTEDLPAIFDGNVLTVGPNTNTYNIEDAYWTNPDGTGNKFMEANMYSELPSLGGQTLTFVGETLEYTFVDGYESQAFIKVLDPDAGWATIATAYAPLAEGEVFSVSLDVPEGAQLITQYGFMTTGINANPDGVEALGHAMMAPAVPEPASLALLALGGLAIVRRR